MSPARSLIGLAIWIGMCFGTAVLGSIFTTPSVTTWYAGLIKPSWTPPNWIFGPVWTALYFMMALAVWLVWRRGGFAPAPLPITVFLVQLALNAMWPILFFRLRMPGVAFAEIVLLWLAIHATVIAFWRSNRTAGSLLLPYLIWTTFAGALNYAIWKMNAAGIG